MYAVVLLNPIMTHMDQFPFSHIENAELVNTLLDQHSKLEHKMYLNNRINPNPSEGITRGDSLSRDILTSNDPDLNCFTDLNQSLISDCRYLLDEDSKAISAQFKKKEDLSFMHVNVRSISKNMDLLSLSLSNLNHTFSAIGISETWLNNDNAQNYGIENYNHVYRCRDDIVGGGVSLFINTSLEYKERLEIEKCLIFSGESVFIETGNHTIIGCIYRPPSLSISDFNSHLAYVLDILSKERKQCYIMGDFNINIIDSVKNKQINLFLDMMFSYCFHLVISKPTRVTETSATLIDNIFTNVLD